MGQDEQVEWVRTALMCDGMLYKILLSNPTLDRSLFVTFGLIIPTLSLTHFSELSFYTLFALRWEYIQDLRVDRFILCMLTDLLTQLVVTLSMGQKVLGSIPTGNQYLTAPMDQWLASLTSTPGNVGSFPHQCQHF